MDRGEVASDAIKIISVDLPRLDSGGSDGSRSDETGPGVGGWVRFGHNVHLLSGRV